eukprot:TRINITY_DN8278_c0_g1_i2.p1 TRINITY_DN8278_c0_g1~~TRINITY_DN8278_c0_g1_i2.p1  ORF type:complete len:491 (+),score=102.49 TRINITY_DN8278_c0_g1_i2:44-1474(+)
MSMLWQRDGKHLPGSSTVKVVMGLMSFTVIGVFGVVVVPATIGYNILRFIFRGRKTIRKVSPEEDNLTLKHPLLPHKDRKYDIILFGVTGFTGGLAASYMAKQYGIGGDVKWAIAGRRADALQKIKDSLGLPDLDIIVADTSNEDTLHDLIYNTRAIVTTVGPFQKYGTPIVKFCANYGTHYSDITGETEWNREMIDRFDSKCKETGARIVSFCGHDCVPWDLSVLASANMLQKRFNSPLKSVQCYDYIKAEASGGTIATVLLILFATSKYGFNIKYDPLMHSKDGESKFKTKSNLVKHLTYEKQEKRWVAPFVMADCNACCVKRSNALNGYGEKVTYREGLVLPGFLAGVLDFFRMMTLGVTFLCPPLLWLAKKYVLPSPGEGPSVESMNRNWLYVHTHAQGEKEGTAVKSHLYFPTDPGYRETARMVAEAGLTLALTDPSKLPGTGGILTPASGCGMPYLERLTNTGAVFEFEE